jgi:S1-C subfamily serine protease
VAPGRRARGRAWLLRHERWLWAAGALLLALAAGWPAWRMKLPQPLNIEQIDAAMRESIAKEPLASAHAAAYQAVLPSVVRVVGLPAKAAADSADGPAGEGKPGGPGSAGPGPANPTKPGPAGPQARQDKKADKDRSHHGDDDDDGPRSGRSVGTGVVIVNTGLILTNLHVVAEADRIMVTFADGSESEAVVVNRQPSNDLAVLQAKTIPDDLQAATMRSTGGLSPGDQVVAVGFPFGIGPSASAGVISGLKREFRSPQGQRILTNLIQFDAAANPGNSGGPLVTLDGHVVGIVTAIMNPEGHSTFIGIGFAVPIENAASAAGMPPF